MWGTKAENNKMNALKKKITKALSTQGKLAGDWLQCQLNEKKKKKNPPWIQILIIMRSLTAAGCMNPKESFNLWLKAGAYACLEFLNNVWRTWDYGDETTQVFCFWVEEILLLKCAGTARVQSDFCYQRGWNRKKCCKTVALGDCGEIAFTCYLNIKCRWTWGMEQSLAH